MEYCHTSFSDHKYMRVANKLKYTYKPPGWKPFLFSQQKFLDLMKNETEWFLRRNSDQKNNVDVENFSLDELTFLNVENQSTRQTLKNIPLLTKKLQQLTLELGNCLPKNS